MTNILEAINNIANQQHFEIKAFYNGNNRANNMGDALENYIKDAFANTFCITDEQERMKIFSKKFSWLGTKNNPPDIMIKGGDAIEVKKIQNDRNNLALNSSYPKSDLRCDSPMITEACKNCENWTIKDIIYCVGNVDDSNLKSLWLIYGNIYAAKKEVYQRIKTIISRGINEIPDIVFSDTKELGRINQVDPLGITSLRIRGMWTIEHPKKVFDYLWPSQPKKFILISIIPTDKYDTFPLKSRQKIENPHQPNLSISDAKVKNPDNPAQLIDCKLIKFMV